MCVGKLCGLQKKEGYVLFPNRGDRRKKNLNYVACLTTIKRPMTPHPLSRLKCQQAFGRLYFMLEPGWGLMYIRGTIEHLSGSLWGDVCPHPLLRFLYWDAWDFALRRDKHFDVQSQEKMGRGTRGIRKDLTMFHVPHWVHSTVLPTEARYICKYHHERSASADWRSYSLIPKACSPTSLRGVLSTRSKLKKVLKA